MTILFSIIWLGTIIATPTFIPKLPACGAVEVITAEISGYSAELSQTDSDPETMASGKKVYLGAIACPRRYPFGTKIEIRDNTYTCEDRMALKNDGKFDILFSTRAEAIQFGRRTLTIRILQ